MPLSQGLVRKPVGGVLGLRRPSPRAMRRMLKRMGMEMAPLAGVEEVIIRLSDRSLVMEDPEVFMVEVGGQRIYQIVPGRIREELVEAKRPAIPEEDVQLVAQQAGVSLEEARAALEEAGGDLAKAILLLTGQG